MASPSRPGHYETVAAQLATLLDINALPFIYLYDSESPRLASQHIRNLLQDLSEKSSHLRYAFANAVACFTPRLFFDTVINALARHTPSWEDSCENWAGPSGDGMRWNESLDTFLHGLRAVAADVERHEQGPSTTLRGKGKARAKPNGDIQGERCRLVLVVECPERLKDNMPELLVPLTRLAELSQTDITTILISNVRWEEVRPSLGASPEPLYIDTPTLSREAILNILTSYFPRGPHTTTNPHLDRDTYHPLFAQLYTHYLATVYGACGPFTHDPDELAYIAAARWPGFIQPVLDEYHRDLSDFEAWFQAERNGSDPTAHDPPALAAPTEDTRLRLTRLFTPSLTAALEALHPRHTSAADWARAHAPPPDLLLLPPAQAPSALRAADPRGGAGALALARMAKFVLVAAFLASTNPPKSDVRMFGRGPDERKRRRRKGGGPRKTKPGTATKIPQRLLGPLAFPLDRLLAILGVLLEENDADVRPPAPQYAVPGEYTDVEISRVAIYAQVMELASMRLLLRTSPAERLDAPPTFKCGVSYEVALRLAKDVGIPLSTLMWEGIQYGNM